MHYTMKTCTFIRIRLSLMISSNQRHALKIRLSTNWLWNNLTRRKAKVYSKTFQIMEFSKVLTAYTTTSMVKIEVENRLIHNLLSTVQIWKGLLITSCIVAIWIQFSLKSWNSLKPLRKSCSLFRRRFQVSFSLVITLDSKCCSVWIHNLDLNFDKKFWFI